MSEIFGYTIPNVSTIESTDDTIINKLLDDIKTTDISNTTYTTLEKSNTLKNSQKIKELTKLGNFLQELERLNRSLD